MDPIIKDPISINKSDTYMYPLYDYRITLITRIKWGTTNNAMDIDRGLAYSVSKTYVTTEACIESFTDFLLKIDLCSCSQKQN